MLTLDIVYPDIVMVYLNIDNLYPKIDMAYSGIGKKRGNLGEAAKRCKVLRCNIVIEQDLTPFPVAEVRGGIGELAKKTNINRQHLYRTLSRRGNPRLDTLKDVLHGLGFRLSIVPLET